MTSSQSLDHFSVDEEESSSPKILKQDELTTRSQMSDLEQQLPMNNSAEGKLSLGDLPPEEHFGFESMPNEVLCNVLKYLPSNDLLNLALCSNDYDDVAWYSLKKRDFVLKSMILSVDSIKSPHGIETSRYELCITGVSLTTMEGNQDRMFLPSQRLPPSSLSYSYESASRIATIMGRLLRKGDVSKMKVDLFKLRPENPKVKRMANDVLVSLCFYLETTPQEGPRSAVSIDVLCLTPESVCLLEYLSPDHIDYQGPTECLFSSCVYTQMRNVASIQIINYMNDDLDNFMEKCRVPVISFHQDSTWSDDSFNRILTHISMTNEPKTIKVNIRGTARKWQQMFFAWVWTVRSSVAARVQMKIDDVKLEVIFQRGGSNLDGGEPEMDD